VQHAFDTGQKQLPRLVVEDDERTAHRGVTWRRNPHIRRNFPRVSLALRLVFIPRHLVMMVVEMVPDPDLAPGIRPH
jgi:hypothetical protein